MTSTTHTTVASKVLALPGAVPAENAEHGLCDVPLVEPDEMTADGLVWRITPNLAGVRAQPLEDPPHRPASGQFPPVAHLTGSDRWRLVQALSSVDARQQHLAERSQELARSCAASSAAADAPATRPWRCTATKICP